MEKQLLETYFDGKADQELKAQIVAWATASEENNKQFITAKTDWTLQHLPNELADADDFLRFSKHVEKSVESNRLTSEGRKKPLVSSRVYRIAAILAIPLLFASVFQQTGIRFGAA
jgi:hypothetical protein